MNNSIDLLHIVLFVLCVLLFVRNRQTRYLDYLRAKLHIRHAYYYGKVRGIAIGKVYAQNRIVYFTDHSPDAQIKYLTDEDVERALGELGEVFRQVTEAHERHGNLL